MANSLRKCTGCKSRFPQGTPDWRQSPVGYFHDTDCQIAYARAEVEKDRKKRAAAKKKETARKKREFYDKDRTFWVKKTQRKVNEYIRARDKGKPCISCASTTARITAGHFKTAGAHPELRFNEKNIHGQCWWNCNRNLSGNIINFRIGLVDRYGEDYVIYLERQHEAKHYTIENLKTIYKWYDRKLKRLNQHTPTPERGN